jgi:glutathione S-transferase
VLELYQAEWCPYSRQVRQRLTELQLDFVARQVAADPEHRGAMRDATSEDEIPVLLLEDGMALQGSREILRHLLDAYAEGPEAEKHREQKREHEH